MALCNTKAWLARCVTLVTVCMLAWCLPVQGGTKNSLTTEGGQENATQVVTPGGEGQAQQCGTKKRCSQMTSCAEARFYLTTCGVASLDRDKDGIPCESLCK